MMGMGGVGVACAAKRMVQNSDAPFDTALGMSPFLNLPRGKRDHQRGKELSSSEPIIVKC